MRPLLTLSTAAVALLTTLPALAQQASTTQMAADQLPEVTVVATRTEAPVDQVPATVTVFTAEQIERQLFTDIKDLVRYEPGVSVVSQPARFGAALGTAGRAGNEGFTIRGMGGDRVLMVVDGVRTPDGFVFGAQSVGRGGYSDLDLMKSVEILRGPASALYGSDGVAGAVSFTTKDPSDLLDAGRNFGARARVGYNSADEGWTEGLAFAGRSGAFSGMLAYTHRDSQETETHGDVTGEETVNVVSGTTTTPSIVYSNRTLANPQDLSSDALLAKLVWDFAPNQSLRLTYDGYQMESDAVVLSGRTTRTVAAPPTAATAVLGLTAADTTERDRISLDWRFDDTFGLDAGQIAVYGQTSKTRQYTAEDRVGTDRIRDNQFNNEVFGVSAFARRTFGAGSGVEHRLTFGGDWSRTTQEGIRDGTVPPAGETFPTSPFPKTDYSLAGAFIQDEIVLAGGALRIIPAVRFDAYELSTDRDPLYTGTRADQDGDRVSPKLGVVWQATEQFQLFGNYAEGFKAPTPSQVNNGFSNLASGYTSVPNPNLSPETSRSVELGARLTRANALNGVLNAQVVVFQSDYDDFISQQMVGGAFTPSNPAIYQFVNFSSVEVEGVEVRANVNWDNGVFFRGAAAYADGDQTNGTTTAKLTTIDPLKVVLGLGYNDNGGRFGFEGIVTWSNAKDPRDTNGLSCFNQAPSLGCYVGKDFALVDITAYWNVTNRATARAGLFNVTDETYGWWSDVRGVAATSAVRDAYTQPGRNFGLSLSLRL